MFFHPSGNIFAVADCGTAGLSAPAFLEPFWEAGNLSFSIPPGKKLLFLALQVAVASHSQVVIF